jgi:hypothetical protein
VFTAQFQASQCSTDATQQHAEGSQVNCPGYDDRKLTVPPMRADNVVAAALRCSSTDAIDVRCN